VVLEAIVFMVVVGEEEASLVAEEVANLVAHPVLVVLARMRGKIMQMPQMAVLVLKAL
jgi:hypothetical protein